MDNNAKKSIKSLVCDLYRLVGVFSKTSKHKHKRLERLQNILTISAQIDKVVMDEMDREGFKVRNAEKENGYVSLALGKQLIDDIVNAIDDEEASLRLVNSKLEFLRQLKNVTLKQFAENDFANMNTSWSEFYKEYHRKPNPVVDIINDETPSPPTKDVGGIK